MTSMSTSSSTRQQPSWFGWRATAIGAGIYDGDLLVVDRSIQPAVGHIVVVVVDGELTLKRLARRGDRMVLQAENEAYPLIQVGEDAETLIWGVATSAIHFLAGTPPRQRPLAAE